MELVILKRFDVVLINLDPTVGSEIKKTRPCVIISPDSMNMSRLSTIIIAPLTSTIRKNFPTRVDIKFDGKEGQVALDQLRVIDKNRIIKLLGKVKSNSQIEIIDILQEMFSS